MSPLWFVTRVAGATFLTVGGLYLLTRMILPKDGDLLAGAIHFRNSAAEFQKGISAVIFGTSESSAEDKAKRRESSRIVIE